MELTFAIFLGNHILGNCGRISLWQSRVRVPASTVNGRSQEKTSSDGAYAHGAASADTRLKASYHDFARAISKCDSARNLVF